MLDRVKAGVCQPGMRQQELVVGPWHCRLLHDIHDDLDLLYFNSIMSRAIIFEHEQGRYN
jgi:hypothetical protein